MDADSSKDGRIDLAEALVFFYGLFIVKLNQFPGNVFSLFNDSLLYATAACLALILISLLVFPHILY